MLLLIFRATIEASKSNGLLLLFLKFIRTNSLVQFSFISRKKNLSGDTINFYSPPLSSTPPQQRKKKRKSIQGSRGRQRRQAGSLAANLRESLCLLVAGTHRGPFIPPLLPSSGDAAQGWKSRAGRLCGEGKGPLSGCFHGCLPTGYQLIL